VLTICDCKASNSLQSVKWHEDTSVSCLRKTKRAGFDLSDHLSEERVESPLGLLNGDVGFVMKPNSEKQIVVFKCFFHL
jgi:hypothetical protein